MLSKLVLFVLPATIVLVTCAPDIGTSPYDCHNTKGFFALKTSDNKQSSNTGIIDTIGNSISYGFNSNLFMNVDSVTVFSTSSANPDDNIFVGGFKNISSRKNTDTVWNSFMLADTGTISLKGFVYVPCNTKISGTMTVTVVSRPVNHPPKLVVPREITKHPGDTITLVVTASDSDITQILTYSALYLPTGSTFDPQTHIFTWMIPATLTGIDSALFKVRDNGYSPRADSQTVLLNILPTAVNRAPTLSVTSKVRNINPGDTWTLYLKASDPDSGQTTTISMLSSPPGSVLKDVIFTWVAPATFIGADSAIFMAKDNGLPPKSDTVKAYVLVSNNIPLPSRPDSLKILSRLNGWANLQWHGSAVADFYTVFRADTTHVMPFIAIDTVYDTLAQDSVGLLSYRYYVKAFNSSGSSPSSDTITSRN